MICTHLSSHILSCQFGFGKVAPGSVSKTVEIINQEMANRQVDFFLFNQFFYNDSPTGLMQKVRAPEEAPVLTNYRTKITIDLVSYGVSVLIDLGWAVNQLPGLLVNQLTNLQAGL